MDKLFKNRKLYYIVLIAAISVFTVNFISRQSALMSKKQELNELIDTKNKIQIQIDATEKLLNESEESTYIENVAREKLGYMYPGEKIYIDIRGE